MAIPTREAYGRTLAKLVEENKDIVVLDADLSGSTKTALAKKVAPERHFNMGIAEANMLGVAAGLAASGKTVFASSFVIFATGRAWEQMRNSVCYPELNVKLCGSHGGLSVGEDGATHQSLEDVAIMRAIPRLRVYQPCDARETEAVIRHVAEIKGPCYVRLGRANVDDVYEGEVPDVTKVHVLRQGEKVALLATGYEVQQVLKAADILKEQGINANCCCGACHMGHILALAATGGALTAGNLHAVGSIHHYRIAQLAHNGQAAHIGHEGVVAKAGATLGEH